MVERNILIFQYYYLGFPFSKQLDLWVIIKSIDNMVMPPLLYCVESIDPRESVLQRDGHDFTFKKSFKYLCLKNNLGYSTTCA